jgi:peroxiredoxin
MALGPGDPLPDVPLATAEGEEVSLASLRGEDTVLIFLRHLA